MAATPIPARRPHPPDALMTEVSDRMARAGLRPTRNRLAIIEALQASPRPLTIHEILDAQPQLAQSSAYRNLVVLEAARTIRRIVTDHEFARYELAEDLTGHHHHLICIECGAVEDVSAPAGLERSVHSAAEQIALSTGFLTEHHRIDLLGRCKRCA